MKGELLSATSTRLRGKKTNETERDALLTRKKKRANSAHQERGRASYSSKKGGEISYIKHDDDQNK